MRNRALIERRLVYFHRKEASSGNLVVPNGEGRFFVTICISYNSRFARYLNRQPSPTTGTAREIVMGPGTITVSDAGQMVEYPTGYDGECPTKQDAQEGEDGGFSIVLIY